MNLPKRQTIVITGGNSGIGFAVAEFCARLNYRIILAVRNEGRGEEAKQKILALSPDCEVEVRLLNLSDLSSISDFADHLIKDQLDVDIFYCNAGIYRVPFATIFGGLESQMAVNFAANLILFRKLEDYFRSLNHEVKFVLTSSIVARLCTLNPGDLYGEKKYDKSMAYRKSKLAVNHLFEYLKVRTQGSNIVPLLVHPGIVFTPLIAKAYPNKIVLGAKHFLRLCFNKPEKAALSTMRLLEEDIHSPCFCGPRGLWHTAGYPKIYPLHQKNIHDVDALMDETLKAFG